MLLQVLVVRKVYFEISPPSFPLFMRNIHPKFSREATWLKDKKLEITMFHNPRMINIRKK